MPETGSIENLKSVIAKRKGISKPNKFDVEFMPPRELNSDNQDLSILCESVSMPSRQISTIDFSTYRHSYKIPNGYSNVDVTCVFLMTGDFFPKNLFDRWTSLIVDPVTYRIRYVKDYSTNINIYQLDNNMERIYGIQLQQAFPTQIQALEYGQGSNDTAQKLSVTFSYYDILNLDVQKK